MWLCEDQHHTPCPPHVLKFDDDEGTWEISGGFFKGAYKLEVSADGLPLGTWTWHDMELGHFTLLEYKPKRLAVRGVQYEPRYELIRYPYAILCYAIG